VSRPTPIDKAALRQAIVDRLREDLVRSFAAARAAEAGATDPQNKAENKYDTRGLELSYLAAGQARRVADLEATVDQFQAMPLRDFAPDEAAGLGAVVTVAMGKDEATYFLAPQGGGTEVVVGKREVFVITPLSPLGQQLIGKKKGDTFSLTPRGPTQQVIGIG
jgi:hypothetical protein